MEFSHLNINILVINEKTDITRIVPHICMSKVCFIQDWCLKKCLLKLEGSLGKQEITVRLKVMYLCQMKGQNSEGGGVLHARILYLGKENHRTAACERHLWRSLSPTTCFFNSSKDIYSTACDGLASAVTVKKFFHMFSWKFISVWTHFFLSCHWTSLKRAWLSFLKAPIRSLYSLLHIHC